MQVKWSGSCTCCEMGCKFTTKRATNQLGCKFAAISLATCSSWWQAGLYLHFFRTSMWWETDYRLDGVKLNVTMVQLENMKMFSGLMLPIAHWPALMCFLRAMLDSITKHALGQPSNKYPFAFNTNLGEFICWKSNFGSLLDACALSAIALLRDVPCSFSTLGFGSVSTARAVEEKKGCVQSLWGSTHTLPS